MIKLLDNLSQIPMPEWLTGPIFDKELRVASRRKRYYFLRVLFILFLLGLVCQAWAMAMTFSHAGSSGFVAMRMSEVSRGVVSAMVWMEFVLLPLLAVVMLSGAISQESNKRTLDVLLTTPITSLQLVTGKVMSCLLQLVLLAGMTFPLFAIIRIFGGVPWDFVVASLCMTLTTTCLFGAVSLLFSIRIKQAYRVVACVGLAGAIVYGLAPAGLGLLMSSYNWVWVPQALDALSLVNPYTGMYELTESMLSSYSAGAGIFSWQLHCLISVAIFLGILGLSAWRVRTAMGGYVDQSRRKSLGFVGKMLGRGKSERVSRRRLAEIKGDPITWKEMQRSEGGNVINSAWGRIILIVLIGVAYITGAYMKWLMKPEFHAGLVTSLALLGFLRFGVLSALSISSEKQAKTWPILLTAPIDDGDIIKRKVIAIWKKTMIYWIVILADVIIFSVALVLHPLAIIGVLTALVPTLIFLMGVGMYFGMRLKSTTGAMAATLGIPVALWFLCPCFANFSPLGLIAMSVAVGFEEDASFFVGIVTAISFIPAAIYGIIGWVLLYRAKYSMRKYLFNVT